MRYLNRGGHECQIQFLDKLRHNQLSHNGINYCNGVSVFQFAGA